MLIPSPYPQLIALFHVSGNVDGYGFHAYPNQRREIPRNHIVFVYQASVTTFGSNVETHCMRLYKNIEIPERQAIYLQWFNNYFFQKTKVLQKFPFFKFFFYHQL